MTAGGAGGPAGHAGPAPGDAAVGDSAAAPSWESLTGEDLVDAYRVTLGTRAAGVCVLAARDAAVVESTELPSGRARVRRSPTPVRVRARSS